MPVEDPDDELLELWNEAKPKVLARCKAVGDAAATGDADLVVAAQGEAHKLAGAVGMFGFVEASALAIRLDDLVRDGALEDGRRAQITTIVDELTTSLGA